MYTYINKDAETLYVELQHKLDPASNQIGTTWDNYVAGCWVLLTADQIAFRKAHPTASVEEVFNMRLTPMPEPEPIPEPTEEEKLDEARQRKIQAILEFDQSPVVNSFTVNGKAVWLTPDVRANYRNSIEAAELLGEATITFIIAGIIATTPLQDARLMLASVQRYADKSTIATEQHKANVWALSSLAEIEAYDHTVGYPEKPSFTLLENMERTA